MPAVETQFEGGCLCGAVRYLLTAAPNYVYFCHCRDCQRESGSPFVTDMNIDRAALQIAGPLRRYTRTGDSGKSIHRNFCTICGTSLLTEFDVDPEHVSIKACSLAGSARTSPALARDPRADTARPACIRNWHCAFPRESPALFLSYRRGRPIPHAPAAPRTVLRSR